VPSRAGAAAPKHQRLTVCAYDDRPRATDRESRARESRPSLAAAASIARAREMRDAPNDVASLARALDATLATVTTERRREDADEDADGLTASGATATRARDGTTIAFRTSYWTNWGENLVVCGADAALGRWNPARGLRMRCRAGRGERELEWRAETRAEDGGLGSGKSANGRRTIEYRYAVIDEREHVIAWDGEVRTLELEDGRGTRGERGVECADEWNSRATAEHVFERKAFASVVTPEYVGRGDLAHEVVGDRCETNGETTPAKRGRAGVDVRLEIKAPRATKSQRVVVRGSCAALKSERSLGKRAGTDVWTIEFQVDASELPFEYSYALRDGDDVVEDARGARECSLSDDGDVANAVERRLIHRDGVFTHGGVWKGSGMALPVFSVRTAQSVGCGDFVDLRQMVDFASTTGMSVVQVLPVNDTCVYGTFWDSYPYSSLSVHALHVMYLRVQELSGVTAELAEEIEAARVALDLKEIDYEATVKEKLSFARRAYYTDGEKVLASDDFQTFYKANESWLRPYGVFCVLRDLFGTAEHWRWGVFATFSKEILDKIDCPGGDLYESTRFFFYLQYNLHTQLVTTAQYAKSKGVILKGDLPVGVDKRSVDTWMHPRLFRMDTSTGAPPDAFDANGQNWGFPTYNWETMAEDDYAWWRARMQHLEQYFSAIRIDHILGFFRIWELPASATTGRMGRFRPSLPLTRDELAARGLWDLNRLTQPYIQWHELEVLFGENVHEIAYRYMIEVDDQRGLWQFRREFDTEQAIFAATKPRGDFPMHLNDEQLLVRAGLMQLFQNRCLLTDVENIDHFYPRFGLEETTSFQALEGWMRDALRDLSNDYYFGRQTNTWRKQARKVLPALLKSTEMLVCGEDLGFTPMCVPPVMDELGILGLRIQRMPPVGESSEFGRPHTYSYLTVCSPSCHDTMTTRAWWEEDAERRARYDEMFQCGNDDACTPSVMRRILTQHIESPSVLAIFPIQDVLALDERYAKRPALEETINDPTNPKHYWRFRIHVACEELLANASFVKEIKDLVRVRSQTTST